MAQAGWQVHVSNSTPGARGVLRHMSEDGDVTVWDMLPPHPRHEHGDSGPPRCVLPSTVAQLVTERIELPPGADRNTVYVSSAHVLGGGNAPLVRVVWFTPETADMITGSRHGTHSETTRELHNLRTQIRDPHTSNGGNLSGPATGPYMELGVGCLPGVGRQAVKVGGSMCVVPFSRNPEASTAVEPCLTNFMSDVSHVLHQVLPAAVMHAHASPSGCPREVSCAYQYPCLRSDAPPLSSHQVVLRGSIPYDMESSSVDSDERARQALSDLHIDPWDGGGDLGTCTVHVCSEAHGGRAFPRDIELLAHRGNAVFPHPNGGRGVHVCSVVPGWHCAILCQTSARLHGSVLLDKQDACGFALPHYDITRVVSYPLARIETLLRRLSDEPEKMHCLCERSDQWVRARMK